MKSIKFLVVTFLLLSFVLTGCQDLPTSRIDLNKMLTKDTKEPVQSFELKESISLQIDYDESVLDDEDIKILELLSNIRLDLHVQKNKSLTKIDGSVVLERGEIPFIITSNAEETIIWIDNATKPFVYEGNIMAEYQRNFGYLLFSTESSYELTEEAIEMVDVIVNNLPNINTLKYDLYDRTTINSKNVALMRIDAKLTAEEIPAFLLQFLNNIKEDESIKDALSNIIFKSYDYSYYNEEEDALEQELIVEEIYQDFIVDVDNAIWFIEGLSTDWPFDDQSFIQSTLYIDDTMRIVKADNTLTFVTPDELKYDLEGLNGFSLNIAYERFNLNKEFSIDPIDMEDQTFITTESSEEEAIASLNKAGVFYDILRKDFRVIPIQTMVLTLDKEEVEINYEDKDKETMLLNVAPYSINGTTLVPVRFFSENLGAEVTWNEELEEVTIVNEDNTIILPLYEDIAYVNGEEYWLDVVTETKDGNAMVPLRFISEVFDLDVTWDGELETITLEQYE